jgi:pheromone shutdown-related protein TraB
VHFVLEHVGDHLVLIGTAHVSQDSVDEVRRTILAHRPDVVCVELDEARLEALEDRKRWEETPVHRFLKGDKVWLFLTQVLLSSYQRRLGKQLGVQPGADMLAGVTTARDVGAEVDLSDRNIGTTMSRAYRLMRFREKMRLSWQVTRSIVGGEGEDDEVDFEELMKEDMITRMMEELGEMAPSIKRVLIDERDAYLAEKIRRQAAGGKRVVAVVGAGHLAGIKARLAASPPVETDLAPLEEIPVKRFGVGKIIGWGIPLLLVGLLGYFAWLGFESGNWTKLRESAAALFIWGGGLAALGALLARGHPFSVITAFLAAPLGILHPGLATGWFSGLVEAWRRTPVVKDFEGIATIESGKDFWNNRVIRVVMVAALTNVGAMIGGAIAAGKIVSNLT